MLKMIDGRNSMFVLSGSEGVALLTVVGAQPPRMFQIHSASRDRTWRKGPRKIPNCPHG